MQNLHRHTSYSNVCIADSAATNEQYAKRAVELGHKVVSSTDGRDIIINVMNLLKNITSNLFSEQKHIGLRIDKKNMRKLIRQQGSR